MSKIRAEFYNNLIDRILDSKLEAETRLEEELVEKIFFAINTVVERQGGFDDNLTGMGFKYCVECGQKLKEGEIE